MAVQIQQKFCLLYWYVGERNWTVQNCNSIVQPRCDPDKYEQGDLVMAKFQGSAYHAAIVRIGDIKDDLKEDKIKLEEFLKDLTLSPRMVMQKMGVEVSSKMDANKSDQCDDKKNNGEVQSATVSKKKKSTVEKKLAKKTKPVEKNEDKKKEIKQQEREKQLAAIETSKLMARKLLASTSESSVQDNDHDQKTNGQLPDSADLLVVEHNIQGNTTKLSDAENQEPFLQAQKNMASIDTGPCDTSEMYKQAYSTINAPAPSFTELLNNAEEDWGAEVFNQHTECYHRINYLEEQVKILQGRNDFLEGKLLEDFLTKLLVKVASTSRSSDGVSNSGLGFMVSNAGCTGAVSNSNPSLGPTCANSGASSIPELAVPNSVSKTGCTTQSPSPQSTMGQQSSVDTSLTPQQLVDLAPGYPVRISSGQLNTCMRKARGSATALARLLLVVYFDNDTLSNSCARGTSNRAALNQDILDAIIRCCVDFNKGKTPEKDIIQAVNGKCSDIRQEKIKSPKVKK